jgi:protein-S-isoprenylcysteine O-methyltransferase
LTLGTLVTLLFLLFPLSEILLAIVKRSRGAAATEDRGSLRLLWLTISMAVALAIVLQFPRAARLPLPATMRVAVALGLLAVGLAIRWVAILTLGRFFTVNVAVHEDHRLVETGLYRYVRHPSYTGLLLAFLGLGVLFGNWLSIAALMILITLAVMRRIRVEESALAAALGTTYTEYCARTKRLVPGLL